MRTLLPLTRVGSKTKSFKLLNSLETISFLIVSYEISLENVEIRCFVNIVRATNHGLH